jgi:uncharacterized protein (TIGR03067 family)
MLRLAVLMVCCTAGALAAAPAPLPKARRGNDAITLGSCQGVWAVDHLEVADGQGRLTKTPWGVTHVRISGDRWTLLNNDQVVADVLRIAIDASKSPAHIDWLPRNSNRPEDVSFVGIVRRRGDRLLITFLGGSTNRAADFESLPAGTYLITARR